MDNEEFTTELQQSSRSTKFFKKMKKDKRSLPQMPGWKIVLLKMYWAAWKHCWLQLHRITVNTYVELSCRGTAFRWVSLEHRSRSADCEGKAKMRWCTSHLCWLHQKRTLHRPSSSHSALERNELPGPHIGPSWSQLEFVIDLSRTKHWPSLSDRDVGWNIPTPCPSWVV